MHGYSVRDGNREEATDLSGFGEIGQRQVNFDGGRKNAYIWWLMYVTIERSRILHLFSKGDLQSWELGSLVSSRNGRVIDVNKLQ